MSMNLDKTVLHDAMEAFWETDGGNEKGVEAAIAKYLDGMDLAFLHSLVVENRERKADERISNVAHARNVGMMQ